MNIVSIHKHHVPIDFQKMSDIEPFSTVGVNVSRLKLKPSRSCAQDSARQETARDDKRRQETTREDKGRQGTAYTYGRSRFILTRLDLF
jgi:hypothetical protein